MAPASITGATELFTYDNRNRLVEVRQFASSTTTGTPGADVKYEYDTLNRMVSRTEIDSGSTQQVTKFIDDGNNVVLTFAATGTATPALKQRFLNGPAIDQILAQETVDDSTSNHVLWFLTDNQNTTRELVDEDGNFVDGGTFVYDPYGHLISGDTSLTSFLYTGKLLDSTTGLQYNENRWYDSTTGRWMSEDPIGEVNRRNGTMLGSDGNNPALVDTAFADGPNPYSYVKNSPTNATDPNGLAAQDVGWGWSGLGDFVGDYWYYLTNPSQQDQDIQTSQTVALMTSAVCLAGAGGLTAWGLAGGGQFAASYGAGHVSFAWGTNAGGLIWAESNGYFVTSIGAAAAGGYWTTIAGLPIWNPGAISTWVSSNPQISNCASAAWQAFLQGFH